MAVRPSVVQRLHARALAATLLHAHRDREKAAQAALLATLLTLPWVIGRVPWLPLALWVAALSGAGMRAASRRPHEGARLRREAAKERILAHPLRLLVIAQLAARPGAGDGDVLPGIDVLTDHRRVEERWLAHVSTWPLRQSPVELHRAACGLRDDVLAARLLDHAQRTYNEPWIAAHAAIRAAAQLRDAGAEDVATVLLADPDPRPLHELVDAAVTVATFE